MNKITKIVAEEVKSKYRFLNRLVHFASPFFTFLYIPPFLYLSFPLSLALLHIHTRILTHTKK